MKIAIICHQDCAKSGYELYVALKESTSHDVQYASCYNHDRSGYALAIEGADAIITACDSLAYIKDGNYYLYDVYGRKLYNDGSGHPVKDSVSMISMPVGKKYLRKSSGWDKAIEVWPLSKYRDNFDMVTPVEPDLNYPEINDGWLPHAIDIDKYGYSWDPPTKLTVSAYMADRDSKQVKEYLLPAVEMLKREGIDIKVVLSGGKFHVEHAEFMERKRTSTVYYGQITPLGVYGRSEVEAMAMGVPVICWISKEAIKRAGDISNYGSACMNASSIHKVANILRETARGNISLMDVSVAGREYAEKVHSYSSVAARALKIIEASRKKARK